MTTRQWHPPKSPKELHADCDNCPIARWHKVANTPLRPVWPDGANAATLALVGEYPSEKESKQGLPFTGPAGRYLGAQLAQKNLQREDVWLDSAALCFPPGGDPAAFDQLMSKKWKAAQAKKPEAARVSYKSAIECCRPRLWRTLRLPLCGQCRKPVGLEGALPAVRCICGGKPMKLAKGTGAPPRALLLLGGDALEALTGVGGIQAKQGYVFNSKGHVK